jgi:hypothetical protein
MLMGKATCTKYVTRVEVKRRRASILGGFGETTPGVETRPAALPLLP